MSRFAFFALVVLGFFLSQARGEDHGEGFGEVSYGELLQAAYFPFGEPTDGEITFRVKASSAAKDPTSIVLTMHTTEGKVTIPVARSGTSGVGEFKLPISDELKRSDPVIRFNQPQGSVTVYFRYDGRIPKTLSYRQLVDAYYQPRIMANIIDGRPAGQYLPKRILIRVPDHDSKPLLIRGRGGDLEIHPDGGGSDRFTIDLDAAAMGEGAEVILPADGGLLLEFCGLPNPIRCGQISGL